MSEENGGEPIAQGGGAPSSEAVEPPATTGLPSDVNSEKPSFKTELPEELRSRIDENGMLDGKYASVEDILYALKEIKDKHANLNRELADKEKKEEQEIDAVAKEAQLEQKRNTVIESLVPEFLSNGMVITPEMEEQLLEAGITKEQIELGAYKMKETIALHQSYVGGKEEYDKIMSYHAQTMSLEEKEAFNRTVNSGQHSEALFLGLKAMYEKRTATGQTSTQNTDRIRGDASQGGIKPYATRQELFNDKRYIDSPAGRNDAGAKAKYKARLAVTPENVWR